MSTLRIGVYILTWDQAHSYTAALTQSLPENAIIINSSAHEWVLTSHSSIRLGHDAFYRDQFHAAAVHFLNSPNDIFFSVVGDAFLSPQGDSNPLLERISEVFQNLAVDNLGFSIPQSNWQQCATEPTFREIYSVDSLNDCHAWALSRDLVAETLSNIGLFGSYGWGIDVLAAAIAHTNGAGVYRDYSLTFNNPPGTNYDSVTAHREMVQAASGLQPRLREKYLQLICGI